MPSVTRTIHFEKTQERYELTASPACVHLDGGGNQTETVTVRLMHYKGKESEEITGKSVTVTDGENSVNFTLPAEINQSGSTVISQSLDDREHGAPDSLTVIGILGANNLVIPVVHDGMGVSKADIVFAVGTSQSESPNFSANSPTSATSLITYDNREYYLWQCTMITYTTGSPTFNGYQCLGQVKTFASVTEQYATGTASAATSSWVNDSPASLSRNKGSYLWTRTKLSYNSGNPSYSPNESGTCIGYLGIDGENAVTVQISPEAILHKKATTSSQYSLAIRVWNGKTAVPASGFSAKIQSKPNGLSEYTIASAADSYINYLGISISANTEIYGDITIAVTYNGNTYTKVVPFKTIVNGDPGIKGEKGASLRGPQAWSDLSVGYQFYQGKNSEEYKDIVLYNGNFYSCIKTHVKSATNYPGGTEDTSNGYWKVSENFELIATKVFFAKLAQIDNLEIGDHINIKDKNGVIVLVANKDGLTCKQGTFENVQISGVLNGVSGTFSKLTSLDDNGKPAVAIYFSNEGHLTFEGDIYNQGYDSKKDRGYRFYTSDVWCRGSFGAAGRNVLLVTGTGGYYYTKGTDKGGTYVSFPVKKSSSGDTYYVLDCYGDNGDAAGFPVDTIIFNSSTARYYSILAFATQRIMVVNGNDKKEQYIYSNGSPVKWNGGEIAEVVQLPTTSTFMNPVNTTNVGSGLLIGAFRDNNWS